MEKETKDNLLLVGLALLIIAGMISVGIGITGIQSATETQECLEWDGAVLFRECLERGEPTTQLPYEGWEWIALIASIIIITEIIYISYNKWGREDRYYGFEESAMMKIFSIIIAFAYSLWILGIKDLKANPQTADIAIWTILIVVSIILWFTINYYIGKGYNDQRIKKHEIKEKLAEQERKKKLAEKRKRTKKRKNKK